MRAGRDDWRLPTLDELRTLIVNCDATDADDIEAPGACRASSSCSYHACFWNGDAYSCTGCGPEGMFISRCLFGGGREYWSGTRCRQDERDPWDDSHYMQVWYVNLGTGQVDCTHSGYGCEGGRFCTLCVAGPLPPEVTPIPTSRGCGFDEP